METIGDIINRLIDRLQAEGSGAGTPGPVLEEMSPSAETPGDELGSKPSEETGILTCWLTSGVCQAELNWCVGITSPTQEECPNHRGSMRAISITVNLRMSASNELIPAQSEQDAPDSLDWHRHVHCDVFVFDAIAEQSRDAANGFVWKWFSAGHLLPHDQREHAIGGGMVWVGIEKLFEDGTEASGDHNGCRFGCLDHDRSGNGKSDSPDGLDQLRQSSDPQLTANIAHVDIDCPSRGEWFVPAPNIRNDGIVFCHSAVRDGLDDRCLGPREQNPAVAITDFPPVHVEDHCATTPLLHCDNAATGTRESQEIAAVCSDEKTMPIAQTAASTKTHEATQATVNWKDGGHCVRYAMTTSKNATRAEIESAGYSPGASARCRQTADRGGRVSQHHPQFEDHRAPGERCRREQRDRAHFGGRVQRSGEQHQEAQDG